MTQRKKVTELMDLACVFPPIATRLLSSRRRKKTSAAAVNVSVNVRCIKTDVTEFMASKCWEHIGTHGVFCALTGFTALETRWKADGGTEKQEKQNARKQNMCVQNNENVRKF